MSRLFSRAAGDFIDFSPGGAASFNGGNQTAVFLWKSDTLAENGLFLARNGGGSTVYGINPYLDGLYYYTTGSFTSTANWSSGTWYLTAFTKAAGTAAVRVDQYDYTAASWSTASYGSLADSVNAPVTTMRLGWFTSADVLNGKLAASALYSPGLSSVQLQGMTATLGSWLSLTPAWCVALNQASIATAVPDLSGHGGNQTAISGTAVSADEPPGWSYATSVNLSLAFTANGSMTAALSTEARLAATLAANGSMTAALSTETHLASSLAMNGSMSVALTASTGPTDPIGSPVAMELLNCFTQQLQELPSPPKYIQLRVGQDTGPLIGANVDECCAGLAWIRIANIYPSWDSFPAADNTWLPCGPLAYAVVLEMGMAFCMPWSDSDDAFDNIDPPSTADWATAFDTQMVHQTLMRRTAACCFRPTQRRAVGEWTPLPVEGGCTGGKLLVTVSVMAPCADC